MSSENLDHFAFSVKDLEATLKQLKRLGVEAVVEPYAIGGWREVFVKDPNGIWIELVERKKHVNPPRSYAGRISA